MASPPTVSILLLGDPSCGKTTFLTRLSLGHNPARPPTTPLPPLRDLDQPFIHDIRLYDRAYRFAFSDTAAPDHYSLQRPDVVILCFDCADRGSLRGVQRRWRAEAAGLCAGREERVPVMLLGLKRDRRVEGEGVLFPQEAYRVAQEMRCDRYAECSAITGELMDEVVEDIARVAARTTTEKGALEEPSCGVM